MKASELIDLLQKAIAEHGDQDFAIECEGQYAQPPTKDDMFCFDRKTGMFVFREYGGKIREGVAPIKRQS